MKVMVVNGVNLNFLGIREPELYGKNNYTDLCQFINEQAFKKNIDLIHFQSNEEGIIVNHIYHAYYNDYDGLIINPGAHAHYSYAIYDALKGVGRKFIKVEVHITDVLNREPFRTKLVTAQACDKMICGKGFEGYAEALEYIKQEYEIRKGKL